MKFYASDDWLLTQRSEDNIMLNLVNILNIKSSLPLSFRLMWEFKSIADKNWIFLLHIYQMKLNFLYVLCHFFLNPIKGFFSSFTSHWRKSEINTQFFLLFSIRAQLVLTAIPFLRTLHIKDIFWACNPFFMNSNISIAFPLALKREAWMMTWIYFFTFPL